MPENDAFISKNVRCAFRSLAPNSDQAYRRLGSAYMDSGQGKPGIEAFQKAVELNPYFWQNQNLLGDAYSQTADYPKALKHSSRSPSWNPILMLGTKIWAMCT